MSMVRCYYSCYLINILASIGATYIIYLICKHINKYKYTSLILSYIGRISILILCIHIIDLTFTPIHKLNKYLSNHHLIAIIIIIWRLGFTIILAYLLSKVTFIIKLFKIK